MWGNILLDSISIHAPREGSDLIGQIIKATGLEFQSTLPVRGATPPHKAAGLCLRISIHAPREGSDTVNTITQFDGQHFNPRSP